MEVIAIINTAAYHTDPEFTRNGKGVGHWLCCELDRELRVLETWLWGHWGALNANTLELGLLGQHEEHHVSIPGVPVKQTP